MLFWTKQSKDDLLNCYPEFNQAMLQGGIYYFEEFHLTRLAQLAEYKLKTVSEEQFKAWACEKSLKKQKNWEDNILKHCAFQKIFLAAINKTVKLAFNL